MGRRPNVLDDLKSSVSDWELVQTRTYVPDQSQLCDRVSYELEAEERAGFEICVRFYAVACPELRVRLLDDLLVRHSDQTHLR